MVAELPGPARRARAHTAASRRPRPATPALVTALLAHHPDTSLEQRGARGAAAAPRRLLASSGWTRRRCTPPATRRASARWCSAGSSAAGWSPARTPRSTSSAPAFVREVEPGELIVDRRERPALPPLRRASAQGLRVRVRLPRPPRHHDRRPQRPPGPGRDRPPAGPRVPGRGRPGDPRARVRHARPPSATPRRAASRSARASSRTPTSAAPSSSPARPSASSASGSS